MSSFHLGEFHPAIIHFPIALIFMAFAFNILYWFKRIEIFQSIASWLIVVVAFILIPTALTGFLAKDFYPTGGPRRFAPSKYGYRHSSLYNWVRHF